MKSDQKYRFSLQWGQETKEQIKVGDLLEKMGNKKSKFILMVINEYIDNHPELLQPECKFTIHIDQNQNNDFLRETIKNLISEMLKDKNLCEVNSFSNKEKLNEPDMDEITAMLDNIEFFK